MANDKLQRVGLVYTADGVVDFKKLDLTADAKIIKASKTAVEHLLKQDPHLQNPENAGLKNYYLKLYKGKNKWSRIS